MIEIKKVSGRISLELMRDTLLSKIRSEPRCVDKNIIMAFISFVLNAS